MFPNNYDLKKYALYHKDGDKIVLAFRPFFERARNCLNCKMVCSLFPEHWEHITVVYGSPDLVTLQIQAIHKAPAKAVTLLAVAHIENNKTWSVEVDINEPALYNKLNEYFTEQTEIKRQTEEKMRREKEQEIECFLSAIKFGVC